MKVVTYFKKHWKGVLKTLVFLYVLGGFLLWQFQEKLLFHPVALPPEYQYNFTMPFQEVNIQLNDQETLNMVKFFPADTSNIKGVVLFFHGNRGNINRYAKHATNFTKHGYEVWMPDFPGYGKSTGKLSEERMYADAAVVYKLAKNRVAGNRIIIYGRSLGTGVATQLASVSVCRELILETPYYSISSLAATQFPVYPAARLVHYTFPLHEYLKDVKVPVIIFHGTMDVIIPYMHAVRLKPLLKKTDLFITIQKGGHNNLSGFPLFQQKLDSLLRL